MHGRSFKPLHTGRLDVYQVSEKRVRPEKTWMDLVGSDLRWLWLNEVIKLWLSPMHNMNPLMTWLLYLCSDLLSN